MKIYNAVVYNVYYDDFEIVQAKSFKEKEKAELFAKSIYEISQKYKDMIRNLDRKENELRKVYSVNETNKRMSDMLNELSKFRTDNLFGYEVLFVEIFESELN